jgi:hypothetical protein
MRFIKKEHHQVTSIFTYDIPDEDIIEMFGSLERFDEILSHMNQTEFSEEPFGDAPTDQETDTFLEFYENYNYDRYDDWWTDRKGGYEISYEANDDDSSEDYDSDEEILH